MTVLEELSLNRISGFMYKRDLNLVSFQFSDNASQTGR